MARFYRKKWFYSILALLIGFLILFVALPVLASIRLVETQLIAALEQLTGHKVELGEQPKIGVFPRLHVELNDLTLTKKVNEDTEPIFSADQVRLDMSAWSVINGEIFVQNTRLVRPILKLPQLGEERLISHLLPGDAYRVFRTAEILIKQNPSDADLSSIRSIRIGPVSIDSGAIHFEKSGAQDQNKQSLSSINGDFSATEINGPLRWNIDAIWNGENITSNGTIENVLSLTVGGYSEADFTVTAAPLSGSFSGRIGLGNMSFAEGQTTIDTPAITSALSWLGKDISLSEQFSAISINAGLRARNSKFYFDDAQVVLGDKTGTGSLEIVLEGDIPAANATLAFDSLDLQSVFNGLSHSEATDGINLSIADDIILDLRLSANTATLDPFDLQNVAASLQIKPDTIGMDINDATLFGGQVQAGLRLSKNDDGETDIIPNAELKILASDIEARSLFNLVEWDKFILTGPMTVSLITEGKLESWAKFANASKGSITLRAADVRIDGFSLDQFVGDMEQAEFFPLTFRGSSSISVLETKGSIEAGNISIEDFKARIGDNRIDLSGLYAHIAKSLAMAGSIILLNENGEQDATNVPMQFFVGGSPARPFISPIVPGRLPDLR